MKLIKFTITDGFAFGSGLGIGITIMLVMVHYALQ